LKLDSIPANLLGPRSPSRVLSPSFDPPAVAAWLIWTAVVGNLPHLRVDHLDQGLDIAEGKREGLFAAVVAVDFRDVIRH